MSAKVVVKVPVDVTPLLTQLYWHHRSQANGAPKCREDYHASIVEQLGEVLGLPTACKVPANRKYIKK